MTCQPVRSSWITVTIFSILDYKTPLSPSLRLLGDTTEYPHKPNYKNPLLISNYRQENNLELEIKEILPHHNLISEYISAEDTTIHKKSNMSDPGIHLFSLHSTHL